LQIKEEGKSFCYGFKAMKKGLRINIILCLLILLWSLVAVSYYVDNHYLKKIVDSTCGNESNDQEKVVCIFTIVINSVTAETKGDHHPWWYLTPKMIIERGYGLCSESSKLFIALCTVAGFNARKVSLYNNSFDFSKTVWDSPGSHTVVEVWVDKQWVVFDTYNKMFYRTGGNKLAGIDDIVNNTLITPEGLSPHLPPVSEYYTHIRYINWNHYSWLIQSYSLLKVLVGSKVDLLETPYFLLRPKLLCLYGLTTIILLFLFLRLVSIRKNVLHYMQGLRGD
jgi:hypothetical protein